TTIYHLQTSFGQRQLASPNRYRSTYDKYHAPISRPRPRLHAIGCHSRADLELGVEIAQRTSHALLHHWMIKRHIEHLRDGHSLLYRPTQQVSQVLDSRANHFGTQK